jgi:formate dehydrogenase major subunit
MSKDSAQFPRHNDSGSIALRASTQIQDLEANSADSSAASNNAPSARHWKTAETAKQPFSPNSIEKHSRLRGATVSRGVCPYCAVGCGQLVYTKAGKIIDIEGDPESPINEGTLCPKGANTFQLVCNPHRITKVKYRAPYSDHWEERPLDWAMDRIANLVKETRDRHFVERDQNGMLVNRTTAIAHLGGATLDNEENYLIKKLLNGGLGIIPIENQARI